MAQKYDRNVITRSVWDGYGPTYAKRHRAGTARCVWCAIVVEPQVKT